MEGPLLDSDEASAFHADGFVPVDRLIPDDVVAPLHERFDRIFRGEFETGVAPDEVNWQEGSGDPTLTRQVCNGWRADHLVASIVLSPVLGHALAALAGWSGARIIQDNLLWKPPGARSVGFHRDNAYLAWYRPQEMVTCWIALDGRSSSPVARTVGRPETIRRWSFTHLWTIGRRWRRRLPPKGWFWTRFRSRCRRGVGPSTMVGHGTALVRI
jgi:hypothetical protein